jgi:hypothetical protein
VVRGLYRYVRNPMYLAVLAVIVGQALLLGRPVLLSYAAIVAAAFVAFVYGYEQPTLARRYGAEYEAYRRAVPAWWPRLVPARKAPRADRGWPRDGRTWSAAGYAGASLRATWCRSGEPTDSCTLRANSHSRTRVESTPARSAIRAASPAGSAASRSSQLSMCCRTS